MADWYDESMLGKGQDMVDKLSKLVGIFQNPGLDFRANRANRANRADGDDLLGDAYEYLMRHFATESGKSKGQFYTPAEVSRVIAKVIGMGEAKSGKQTIHDPTCGSGSLLLKAHARPSYIKGIIGLPANLFYGTGIPACILVLDKEDAAARKGIFMIDASRGFIKDGNKNRLREQDIHKIVDTFTRQAEIPRYSRMVPLAEIGDAKNDFNLNLSRYIDASEPEDLQDIDGHLRGGIPNRDLDDLDRYWRVFPSMRSALFKRGDRGGYSELRVAAANIKVAIFGHAEFTEWSAKAQRLFAKWRKKSTPLLVGIAKGDKPKSLIEALSEGELAERYATPVPELVDEVEMLAAQVNAHLKKMGATWS